MPNRISSGCRSEIGSLELRLDRQDENERLSSLFSFVFWSTNTQRAVVWEKSSGLVWRQARFEANDFAVANGRYGAVSLLSPNVTEPIPFKPARQSAGSTK